MSSPVALEPCSACGNGLSPLAQNCPACGHPDGPGRRASLRRQARNGRWLLATSVVVNVAITYFAYLGPIGLLAALAMMITLGFAVTSSRVAIIGGRIAIGLMILALLVGGPNLG